MTRPIPFPANTGPHGGGSGSKNPDRVLDAIALLLEPLSARERDQVLRHLTERLRPIPAPKAGEVLEAVILALPQRSNWNVAELKSAVKALGIEPQPKELYNALTYLRRRGHLQRTGYGRYTVGGAGLETIDDLGLEPARNELQDGDPS